MKRLTILCLTLWCFVVALYAQEIPSAQPGAQYGKPVDREGAIDVSQLETLLETDSVFAGKIEGEVVEVCKKKGCFIRLKRKRDDNAILVRFKDYGFFMPQDIVGKTVVLEGLAKKKEVSVAQLKHFAEDAGKSASDIARITEPKTDINIIADGVTVTR